MSRNVFMDFTETKSVSFGLGGKTFYAYPDVPLVALNSIDQLRQRSENETQQEFVEKIVDVILALLTPESAQLFRECLHDDPAFAGVNTLMQLQIWLTEQVTERPTQESSDSSAAQDETGESSTDGDSAME